MGLAVVAAPEETMTSGAPSEGVEEGGVSGPTGVSLLSTTGVTEDGAPGLLSRVLEDSLLGSRDRDNLVCRISGTEPEEEIVSVSGEVIIALMGHARHSKLVIRNRKNCSLFSEKKTDHIILE